MSDVDSFYAFAFKGALAQDSVLRELGKRDGAPADAAAEIGLRMPFDMMADDLVQDAQKMAIVYTAIAAFENSARKFIQDRGDLASIIQNNFDHFKDHIDTPEWARQIFKSLERSRNVIMHSGELSMNDIERVAMNIRDWLRQVGG